MTEQDNGDLHPILAEWYKSLSKDHETRGAGLWRLPPEHAFTHHYCFLLHDTLAAFVVDGSAQDAFSVSIPLGNLSATQRAEFAGDLEGEALVAWLESNGFEAAVQDLTERQVIAAVISDATVFLYEALRCSEKGKLAVTFALLRKPLRENLLILELLLSDRDRFLRLLATNTGELGIYSLPKSTNALPIIEQAVKSTRLSDTFDPTFLYELRYAKHQHFSLEGVWNKATHLVTTDKHFATELHNLNFVFSDEAAQQTQWDELYRKLPFLLLYFVEIAQALMQRIGVSRGADKEAITRRDLGFSLTGFFNDPNRPLRDSPLSHFALSCPLCGDPVLDSVASLVDLYTELRTRCPLCGVPIDLTGRIPSSWAIRLRQLVFPLRRWFRRTFPAP
jgi:hypothetical protein